MKIPRGYSHPVKIGSGSFSTVLRAREVKLGRPVALKMMAPHGRAATDGVEKEARLLASISSPRVPAIYDVRRGYASVTIAMEWIDGVPLSVLAEKPLSPEIRRSVAADLIRALAQLHAHGVVHRDVKPENIILTPDRGAVFVDFGFSGSGRTASDRAASSPLKGTPRYMAPELWAKLDNIDYVKSDLYSLGVVLREWCVPQVPPCVEELLQSDPSRRPDNCAVFSSRWDECCEAGDEAGARAAIAKAAADHTSRLLYKGACGLYGTGRRAEAYALLTESLDRWPDNPDAVAMLHDRFSSPLPTRSGRTIAAWATGGVLLLLALTGAFVYGKYSRPPVVAGSGATFTDREGQRLSLPFRPAGGTFTSGLPVDFRDLPGSAGPHGTMTVVLPRGAGTLYLDAQPVPVAAGDRFSISTAAGAHRIEWYDSTARRSFGETVDVLPFATRTVSFGRHSDECR